MLSGLGKNIPSFGSLATSAFPKSGGVGFVAYSSTSGTGGFNLGSSAGGSEFETLPEIRTDNVSGEVTEIL